MSSWRNAQGDQPPAVMAVALFTGSVVVGGVSVVGGRVVVVVVVGAEVVVVVVVGRVVVGGAVVGAASVVAVSVVEVVAGSGAVSCGAEAMPVVKQAGRLLKCLFEEQQLMWMMRCQNPCHN